VGIFDEQHWGFSISGITAAEDARADQFDELGLGYLAYTARPARQLAAAENNLSKLTL
jgi:hypothetical protein